MGNVLLPGDTLGEIKRHVDKTSRVDKICKFIKCELKLRSLAIIAPLNNLRTLKYKAQLTITFYVPVNHYRNGHIKAETKQNGSYRTYFLIGPQLD